MALVFPDKTTSVEYCRFSEDINVSMSGQIARASIYLSHNGRGLLVGIHFDLITQSPEDYDKYYLESEFEDACAQAMHEVGFDLLVESQFEAFSEQFDKYRDNSRTLATLNVAAMRDDMFRLLKEYVGRIDGFQVMMCGQDITSI